MNSTANTASRLRELLSLWEDAVLNDGAITCRLDALLDAIITYLEGMQQCSPSSVASPAAACAGAGGTDSTPSTSTSSSLEGSPLPSSEILPVGTVWNGRPPRTDHWTLGPDRLARHSSGSKATRTVDEMLSYENVGDVVRRAPAAEVPSVQPLPGWWRCQKEDGTSSLRTDCIGGTNDL